jgi:uncharacterized protein YegL
MDRSGSMQTGLKDMQGGLDVFLKDQKEALAKDSHLKTTLTFVQFDTEYELVHDFVDITKVDNLPLVPRGMTALNDALGKTLNDVGAKLGQMQEDDRPSLVTVLVITDGEENSSKEFTTEQIKSMIETQEKTYNWKFVYLGADQDSFAVAKSYGLAISAVADYSKSNSVAAMRSLSSKVNHSRLAASQNLAVSYEFTDEDRKELNG